MNFRIILMTCVPMLVTMQAGAQQVSGGPISVVLPFAAGGTSDVAMRMFADVVQRRSGRTILVVNRPGGGGVIAALAVKDAPPDGSTIRLADIGTDAILPSLQNVPYDPLKDFAPITLIMSWNQFVTVPGSSPAQTVQELIAYANSKPGGLSFGSQGMGSGGHILGAMLQTAAGLKFTHIPYKGGAPLALDLLAARVDFSFSSYREMQQPLADKKVRILANAAPRRSSLLPDVPTLAELGIKGVELSPWFGLSAPSRTPRPVVLAIQGAFVDAIKDPELKGKLTTLGIEPDVTSPESFAALIVSERAKYAKVIKEHGIKDQ
jgi:tripartite-type tricarboxylate transporter receptor subunit TctC